MDSTITIPTQEYQTLNEIVELQQGMIEELKKSLRMRDKQVVTLESLVECKNALIDYYEIGE